VHAKEIKKEEEKKKQEGGIHILSTLLTKYTSMKVNGLTETNHLSTDGHTDITNKKGMVVIQYQ